jgi:hypothetical protein
MIIIEGFIVEYRELMDFTCVDPANGTVWEEIHKGQIGEEGNWKVGIFHHNTKRENKKANGLMKVKKGKRTMGKMAMPTDNP